jgi:signal transduction histidine kinase
VVECDAGRLPATTGLALYRILQEALTNAIKHAPGARTQVRLAVGAAEVQLSVDTAGRPAARAGNGAGGFGVLNMHERAESLGGSGQAGPGGDGWLVQATIPLDSRGRIEQAR